MRAKDLIDLFRAELADTAEPYLWEAKELVHYLNLAVQEACERALLIEDRSTASVCQFQTVLGVDTYELHESLIKIKRITMAGRLLEETSVDALDTQFRNWEQQTGQPRYYIYEGAQGAGKPKVRLVPTPSAQVPVQMTVYRGALRPICEGTLNAEPEIPRNLHDGLKHWVYRCALMKNDADTQDSMSASGHEAIFTGIFGAKRDANVFRKHRDRKPPLIRSAW